MLVSEPRQAHHTGESIPIERAQLGRYIAHQHDLKEVSSRLKQCGYRGAICGPSGCGKTAMLQALGDELMTHGLTPLPLFLERDRSRALPAQWRRTIRHARRTDVLLLDGYDLLPAWARLWVWFASMRAGAVVVASERGVWFRTLAHMASEADSRGAAKTHSAA